MSAALLVVAGAVLAGLISVALLLAVLGFVLLNVLYNHVLKHVVLLDVMSIAAGFVLRAVAGAVAIDDACADHQRCGDPDRHRGLAVAVPGYRIGAMLLALSKRRAELAHAGDRADQQRPLLREYSLPMLDVLIGIAAATSIITYALYTFSLGTTGGNVPQNSSMMLTIPFVGYGIMRYLYLLYVKGDGEAPEAILFSDWPTLINLAAWLVVAGAILQWDNIFG